MKAQEILHHNPAQVGAYLIGAAAAVFVVAVLMVIRPRVQRRIFAEPCLDAWRHARRRLRWDDRWRVIWAAQFNQPSLRDQHPQEDAGGRAQTGQT